MGSQILVVDDSMVQRKMIAQIIQKTGFGGSVLEAGDGKQAIQTLGAKYKDVALILCDWNMPNMSGIEFIEAVGKVPAVAGIPVIMVTAEGTEEKIKEANEKNPNLFGYIVKPFTPDQLKEKIEKALKK